MFNEGLSEKNRLIIAIVILVLGVVGYVYLFGGQFQKAEDVLHSVIDFCEKRDIVVLSDPAYLYLSPTLIAKGHMKQGIEMLDEVRQTFNRNQRRT